MANMGLSDLAVVAPRNLNMDEARWLACHATEVLQNRTEFGSLAEAVSDCVATWGTSARKGLYRQHAKTPREWAPAILERAQTGRVALVFGREDNGLSNEEIALCNHMIQIPTTEEYTSLNVAQAVMVCCYELFLASGVYQPLQEKAPEASLEFKERMFDLWRQALLDIGFMEQHKADHMMFGLRRIFARGSVTTDDVRILMGIARQMEWAVSALPAEVRPGGATKVSSERGK